MSRAVWTQVLLLGGADGQALLDLGERCERGAQSLRRARDAGVLPHHVRAWRRRHLRRAAIGERRNLPSRLRPARVFSARHVRQIARDALGEHESLEQRVRRQPIRAVHAGARHLAHRVQPLQRSSGRTGR